MKIFFEPENYLLAVTSACDKEFPHSVLQTFCSVDYRLQLYESIANGTYKISAPRVVKIPKDNGKFREIYINTYKDRLVLSIINSLWNRQHADMISPACMAYLPGKSCATAVRAARDSNTKGYKLDISKYFDSVSREIINKKLQELRSGTPLDDIIYTYYNDDTVYIDGRKQERFKSLAQGSAVSAFLSNCVLYDVDSKMLEMCDYYCRYSDDVIIMGDNADQALEVFSSMISKLGLSLNPDKVMPISRDSEFDFLGFGILGGTSQISQKRYEKKKKEIKSATKTISKDKSLTDDKKLKQAVKAVMHELVNINEPTHSWIYTVAKGSNTVTRMYALDCFCKEHIRAAVTGKWNFTSNVHKVTEEMLRSAGYISVVQLFNAAQIDTDLFKQQCLQSRRN